MRNLIAAIDLGTTKVACIVGERIANNIKIIEYRQAPSKGVARGDVVNIQHVLESISPMISGIEGRMGVKIKEVFVGVSGQYITCDQSTNQISRSDQDQIITKEEIDRLTNSMYNSRVSDGQMILHVIPQFYTVDDYMGVTDPVGMTGQQINGNYVIFKGKANAAQLTKNVISRAGINVKQVILEPIASAMAVVTPDESELGVAVLDIGGGTSDLLIIQDNIIRHAAVIPFGGNSITDDIKIMCGVTSKDAESLKVKFGTCLPEYAIDKKIIIPGVGGRQSKNIEVYHLAEIISERVIEILEAADYEIARSGYKDKLTAGLVLTGGGAKMQNIAQLASIVTGLEAKCAYPDEQIDSQNYPELKSGECATAVGLIIAGFEIMDREKAPFKGVIPVDTTLFPTDTPDEQQPEDGGESEPKDDKSQELKTKKEKKKGSLLDKLKKLKSAISTDGMFNDNQA